MRQKTQTKKPKTSQNGSRASKKGFADTTKKTKKKPFKQIPHITYKKMSYKIYSIECRCGCNMEYVGHTQQELSKRLKNHRYAAKEGKTKFYRHMREVGVEKFVINLIEELSNVGRDVARTRENHYIKEKNTYEKGLNGKYEIPEVFDWSHIERICIHKKNNGLCRFCDISTKCDKCGNRYGEIEMKQHIKTGCGELFKCGGCPALFQKKADKTMHERYCEFIKEMLRKEDPDTYKINPDYENHLQYELEKEQMLNSLRQYKKERNVYVSFLDYKKHLRLKQEWANEDNEKLGLCVFGW